MAIKIYEKEKMLEPNRRRNLKREILILSKIAHPTLVTLFEAYESKKQVYLVQEFVEGGSVHSYLNQKKAQKKEVTLLDEHGNLKSDK